MAEGLLPPVVATLIADTKEYSAKMAEASATMDEFGAKNELTGAKVNRFANKASNAVLGLGVGIAAYALHAGMGFQSAMTQVQNSAGLSVKATTDLGNAFNGTAFQSEFSSTQMADAYAGVAGQLEVLNGKALTTKQAMGVMSSASDLAVAKHISLSDALTTTTSVMKAFQLPVSQAGQVTNQLYVASQLSGQSVSGLAGQYIKMHQRLGVVMPSLADMNTLTLDMNSHGIGAGRALMQVTGAINTMLDPSKKQTDALRAMGVQTFDASGNFVGMRSVLAQLQPAMSGMTKEQQLQTSAAIFGKGPAQAMLQLIQAGPQAYDKASSALQHHKNVTQAAANASKDLKNQLQQVTSGLSTSAAALGVALLPDATAVLSWVTGFVGDVTSAFKKNPWLKDIAEGAAGTAFALALGLKVKNAVSSVLSAGSSIWNGIKGILGKFGIGPGAQTLPLDANTTAINRNTDALLGKSTPAAGTSAVEGGLLGGGAEAGAAGAAGTGLSMIAAPLMVAGAGIALGLLMQQNGTTAPLSKGGGSVYGGRGGGASTGIFEQQRNNQVHVSNLGDIAPALTPIFSGLPTKTGQSVSAAIKGVKLQAKVEDDGSGKATAAHTSIISGLASTHLPLLSSQATAHLPSIADHTQTTADRVGTTNGHMMALIGAVKNPPKFTATIRLV